LEAAVDRVGQAQPAALFRDVGPGAGAGGVEVLSRPAQQILGVGEQLAEQGQGGG
jgi:hypothetical protein